MNGGGFKNLFSIEKSNFQEFDQQNAKISDPSASHRYGREIRQEGTRRHHS